MFPHSSARPFYNSRRRWALARGALLATGQQPPAAGPNPGRARVCSPTWREAHSTCKSAPEVLPPPPPPVARSSLAGPGQSLLTPNADGRATFLAAKPSGRLTVSPLCARAEAREMAFRKACAILLLESKGEEAHLRINQFQGPSAACAKSAPPEQRKTSRRRSTSGPF